MKISAIKLTKEFNNYKIISEEQNFLEPISKINIFIGSNNSGKSRFMRQLSKQDAYRIKVLGTNLNEINSKLSNFVKLIEDKFQELGIREVNDFSLLESDQIKFDISDSLDSASPNYNNSKYVLKTWSENSDVHTTYNENNKPINLGAGERKILTALIKDAARELVPVINQIPDYSGSDLPKQIYIPILRGLRSLPNGNRDAYEEQTRKDYFTTKSNAKELNLTRPEIFTGLTLYERIQELKNGEYAERRIISRYEQFISQSLFEGSGVELTARRNSQVVFVKIGKEAEQPIHHLGDGIQAAIILSFLPFITKEQTFFFIEEPEMFLHPGLQRKILNFFNSLEQHTFFLTTHSNHLLDLTIDVKNVSIFTFRKILADSDDDELTPDFTIEAVDSGCRSSLELLGVRNSSVFLVNATIWVEGITDRWYLREMLNSYVKYLEKSGKPVMRLDEDTHYSFVEYGGANITHWSFLDYEQHPIEIDRLCAKAIVIIDKDGEGKKENRKDALRKKLKKQLVILPCREVENLLPYEVIKRVVEEYEENSELKLKNYSYDQYQNIALGEFIQDTMLNRNALRRGGYKADSGTIKNKVDFCKKALPKIHYENLPSPAKKIIQGIYKFVCCQNHS